MMNAWWWLILAILFEVMGTLSLKFSAISSKMFPAFLYSIIFYLISFIFLAITLRRMEVGIAYAVWSGLGTVLITLLGIGIFGESVSLLKIFCILLIIGGAIGLDLISQSTQ